MQINGSFQIVTFVTSLEPTFLSCIALFYFLFCFSFYCFVLFFRLRLGSFASAEATTGFALWIPTSLCKGLTETFIWVHCFFYFAHLVLCKAATAAVQLIKKQAVGLKRLLAFVYYLKYLTFAVSFRSIISLASSLYSGLTI